MKKKVNFDVSTFCNHKCTFCSNSDDRTIKYQTSIDEFQKVMKNIMQYVEIDEIGLSAKGEVLINKDFVKIVESVKSEFKIPYVYISSNGALMDEKSAIEIIEAGMNSIKFSINAIDAQIESRISSLESGVKQISIPSSVQANDDEKIISLFKQGVPLETISKELHLSKPEVEFVLKINKIK